MTKPKSDAQLIGEGFIFAGLFGLEYKITLSIIRRLLKPYGLRLVVYGNRYEWGDQSWVKIEKIDE